MECTFTEFESYFGERLFHEERRSKVVRDNLLLKDVNHTLLASRITRISYQTKNLEVIIQEYLKNLLSRIESIMNNSQTDMLSKLYLPDMLSILYQNCSYLCHNLKHNDFLHSASTVKSYEKQFEKLILQNSNIESFHENIYNLYVEKYNGNITKDTIYKLLRYRNHIWRVNTNNFILKDKYYNVFIGRIIPEVKDLFEQLKNRLSTKENLIKSLGSVTKYLTELQENLRNIFPITQKDMNQILEFIFEHCFKEIEKFILTNQNIFTSLLLDLKLSICNENIKLYAELLDTLSVLNTFISNDIFLPLFEKTCDEYYEKQLYSVLENKILNVCQYSDYVELALDFIDLLELDEIYTRFNVEKVFGKRTITNPTRKWIEKLLYNYHDKIILSITIFVNLFNLNFFEKDKSTKDEIIAKYLRRLQNREQLWLKCHMKCLQSKYFLTNNEFDQFCNSRKDIINFKIPALSILIQTFAILKYLPRFDKIFECLHHMYSRDHLLFHNFIETPKENYLALSRTFHDLFISELRKLLNEMIIDIEPFLPWSFSSNEYEDIKTKFTGNGGEFKLKKLFQDSDIMVNSIRHANFKTLHCDRVKFNEDFEKYLHQKCLSIDNFSTQDAVVNTLYSSVKIQLALPGRTKVNLIVTLNQLSVLEKFTSFEAVLRLNDLITGFVYEENGILSVNSLVLARILKKVNTFTYQLNDNFGNESHVPLTVKSKKEFYNSAQPYYDLRVFAHNLMKHLIDDTQALICNSKKYAENFKFLLQAQNGSIKRQKFNKSLGKTISVGKLSINESYHTIHLREMIVRVLKRHKILSGINNIFALVNAELFKVNQDRLKKDQAELKQFLLAEVAAELEQLVNIGMLDSEMEERYSYII